jgi:regulator of sigma E protease
MSLFIAILGLAFLILIHEAGHFFASLAVGLRPRRFYVGFPPAIAKTKRKGIEYGVGVIPLGGFVTIPGMHRPIPHDAERRFSRAVEEAPVLGGAVDRVKRSLEGDDLTLAEHALDDFEEALKFQTVSPAALASAEKGITELRDALGADAYWKAATWKRLIAIGAGPAANIALTIVLFTFLFMTVAGQATSTVAGVTPELEVRDAASGETVVVESPAKVIGLRAGDRIVAINGQRVQADEIADTIAESDGNELTLTVVRGGEEVELGPVSGKLVDDRYRLGFGLEGEGLGFFPSMRQAVEVTGLVAKEIAKSLGRLITGDGRDEVSSPIGITQASSDAVERGAESYLWVLGLISLSLALLNLLPLLPLDGGHILFTLIEGARGRFLKREIYERVSMVGLAVVLLLFFVGLSNDIGKLS